MSWIFDNLQILVLVLFAVGSLVKKINESRTTAKQPPRPADLPEPMFETDEESSTFDWPEEPPAPAPLPGAMIEAQLEAAEALKHQQELASHLQQLRETKASTTGGAAATRARVASKGATKPQLAPIQLSLRARLKNPTEIRRAIVLREILGPPVSLR
ncbi:MAG: hypothetical protein QE267_01615 [Akkermansiaceae bacterium]|nr:hypothetical protein [Akkermansiaceae bacterium]